MPLRVLVLACSALTFLSTAFVLRAAQSAGPGSPRIGDFAFLEGAWTFETGSTTIEEHWIEPKAGAMFGVGRTMRADKTVAFEFLRLEERKDGQLHYVAHPNGRSPGTEFKLVSHGEGEYVFENPEHDFPRRILYRLNADGSVSARIEGQQNGKPVSQSFEFKRPAK